MGSFIQGKIEQFLEEHEHGVVHLVYPNYFDTGGIEITKHNINNEHKIEFFETGVMIYQTLGYSLITGKHLFLPYGQCAFVFIEESSDYND
jgi:hypothetical protein